MDKKRFSGLGKELYQAMMTGISYMIPVVVAGALIMAIPNLWTNGNASEATTGVAYYMYSWGSRLFGLMNYMLAMFVAFALAGRPALVSGLIVGVFAVETGAGFLGAVVGGFIAGYVTRYTVKWLKLPSLLGAAKTIFFVPIITSLVTFVCMQFMIGPICSWIMDMIYAFGIFVDSIGAKPLFLAFFGVCFCFGMGGPLCYGVLPLALIYISNGDLEVAAASCLTSCCGCLGTAIATVLFKKKFREDERANVVGCLTGWICEITEFQIPYLMSDFKVFAPAYIISGAVAGAMCGVLHLEMPSDHGGIFTMLMSNSIPKMILCSLIQAGIVVLWVWLFKKNLPPEESGIGLDDE